MPSIKEFITQYAAQLRAVTDSPQQELEIFLEETLQISRAQLLAYPDREISTREMTQLCQWIKRRQAGEPVAYVIGHWGFWTLDLKVTCDTLIPRPETEHLVEWLLEHLPADTPLLLADLGTGTGAIALALASERPLWKIDACDISPAALEVAKFNRDRYGLDHVNFYLGSWCQALPHERYTAIVSNPPYIEQNDEHLNHLFDPRLALVSGDDGLDAIRQIIYSAKQFLLKDGYLLLEHGYLQSEQVSQLLKDAGFSAINAQRDSSNNWRFVSARVK